MTLTETPAGAPRGARKHDFSRLYVAPDPRPLFAELDALGYRVPAAGAVLFRRLVSELGLDGPFLDLACSYGQDAALLNHDVDLDTVYARYHRAAALGVERDRLVADDRAFFALRRRPDAVPVVGLDTSAPALDYALDAGLLDTGVVADLEADPPRVHGDLAALAGVGAVGVTGAISYIGTRTFGRVLDAAGGRPWLAGFALRWVDLAPLAGLLRGRGYEVQVAEERAVVQRRVSDEADAAALRRGLAALGREPNALERAGVHSAVPFLATPAGGRRVRLDELADGLEDEAVTSPGSA